MVDFRNYDFFTEGKDDFYKKFSHNSILCQGGHWKKHPLVTILIPTYKRPELLSKALESALNQKGFSDYQIIVVDNEGRPIEEETPTSQVVKRYQDDRLIYYRHDRELNIYRMDSAVRLAKSPWIVFLHDDDILAENHLKTMTNTIKNHQEIKFLACEMKSFMSEDEIIDEKKSDVYSYRVSKLLKNTTCLGGWSGWQGALIKRKYYIAVGGMPFISTGIGDIIMVAKFLHHFGIYMCHAHNPLYFYREGRQQLTYQMRSTMENILIAEYYFYKYVINKYHKLSHKIWERYVAYIILQRCEEWIGHNVYEADIDIESIVSKCGMPDDIRKKNIKYYALIYLSILRAKCIAFFDYIYVSVLKQSDVHIYLG